MRPLRHNLSDSGLLFGPMSLNVLVHVGLENAFRTCAHWRCHRHLLITKNKYATYKRGRGIIQNLRDYFFVRHFPIFAYDICTSAVKGIRRVAVGGVIGVQEPPLPPPLSIQQHPVTYTLLIMLNFRYIVRANVSKTSTSKH